MYSFFSLLPFGRILRLALCGVDDVAITPGSGATVAADDVGSKLYQRIKRSVGADGSATDFLDKSSRSDTFSGTGSGTTVDLSAQGMSKFGIQVKGTGGIPTAWTVILEGSLDNSNFTQILKHSSANTPADTDGSVKWASNVPCLYFRSRCTAFTGGPASNVVATIVGLP